MGRGTEMPGAAVLGDLCLRFILNVPSEELRSTERLLFQVEQAHWFYEDFVRDDQPHLRCGSREPGAAPPPPPSPPPGRCARVCATLISPFHFIRPRSRTAAPPTATPAAHLPPASAPKPGKADMGC